MPLKDLSTPAMNEQVVFKSKVKLLNRLCTLEACMDCMTESV